MSRKVHYRQPDAADIPAEEERRRRAELDARGLADGRKVRRQHRDVSIGLKITGEKKKQFDRLRMLTAWSYTEILEKALDTFEDWFKANPGAKR